MKKIMFVCTGNICRSPMAHYYMQKKIYELKIEDKYIISSCGTNAIDGQLATDNAIEAMKKYDVDLTKHRATDIQSIDIKEYDLIITLTMNQKNIIIKLYPNFKNKVYTLKEYTDNDLKYKDIDDPWGLDLNIYIATSDEIVKCVDKLINKCYKEV